MTSPEFSTSSAARSLKRSPTSPRTLFSSGMTVLAFACAGLALIPLAAVMIYVLANGLSRLTPSVFLELPPAPGLAGGGFGNAFVGTLLTVGIASLMAIPFGIVGAIYLSEFGRDTKFAETVNFLTNVLSGVPSIVIGAFAYALVVLRTGTFSAVAGGFALAVLMLPTIVRTSAEALESVPNEYRQAAIGLGSTKMQTTLKIVLPAAIPAIVTGIMLAVARAAGETAPVLFTASFNRFWNTTLWQPTATMSRLVFDFATSPFKAQQELAWAGSLVLVALVLITSILSRMVIKRR
ncbi:phosphate ABC transporter permease PstA [Leptolyngbya boryana CZ1]|jgi:phosphate transport system permease protein|uniref:Phosphate transport system permease protein PstA n=2 Tax=Leptolyngbya boryana TaxID=1184 RepID=A0A1Z4JLR6_LEPBY|nr:MULTISPECIES: phosphate ABC transporter permease PstA [Leptolyngbya]BAY57715.1 phosphate ABC transporter inner membrane subunit PstA [Leptolyngbya boryana NIES-2135]MBD1858715.1 phosphate ABC transporter permease PstA [Leptolyngbya sp. FACHB-1624]MBD2367667.1 phosphate ABC transporter permease PstA [Leptolyngbya sp. FACHB-161]MBD2374191.1 phosphate ABC transporter permease PstA [Leptolyngbya sp. FACHB-238]MBD2398816.1 phosphate ABC transporter permease PstA [Leptolyngbya sp. FACHB-239]